MAFKLPNWSELTRDEQRPIIELNPNENWVIEGAPGTGKTVMAIYRASRLSQRNKVLFLVYNVPLMKYIREAINYLNKNGYLLADNCEINTFDSWVGDFYHKIRLPSPWDIEYDKIEDRKIISIDWLNVEYELKSRDTKYYDYVIIDEAQDVPSELIRGLTHISKNITCFIDPNQTLNPERANVISTLKSLYEESPYKLTRNFRNTQQIIDVASLYIENKENVAPASRGSGPKPIVIKTNKNQQLTYIANICNQNSNRDIGIILPKISKKFSEDLKKRVKNTVRLYKRSRDNKYRNEFSFQERDVKIVSYNTMKGLEFDIVFLPMFDEVRSVDKKVDYNRLYVALSRPANRLYILYNSDDSGEVNSMGPIKANRHLVKEGI